MTRIVLETKSSRRLKTKPVRTFVKRATIIALAIAGISYLTKAATHISNASGYPTEIQDYLNQGYQLDPILRERLTEFRQTNRAELSIERFWNPLRWNFPSEPNFRADGNNRTLYSRF